MLNFKTVLWATCLWLPTALASGGVVVLVNRSGREVRFTTAAPDAPIKSRQAKKQQHLKPRDQVSMRTEFPLEIEFDSAESPRRYTLSPNEVYVFHRPRPGSAIELTQVQLGSEDIAAPDDAELSKPRDGRLELSVRLLVDEECATARPDWEARLKRRIERASQILARQVPIELKVIEAGTWNSPPTASTWEALLRDFRGGIAHAPGDVAIGFSGQAAGWSVDSQPSAETAALGTHVLLAEPPRANDHEQMEILVHELGHLLGARHSPERSSVMRMDVGDHEGMAGDYTIRVDPLNTLVMHLACEHWRPADGRQWDSLPRAVQNKAARVYATQEAAIKAAGVSSPTPSERPPTASDSLAERDNQQPTVGHESPSLAAAKAILQACKRADPRKVDSSAKLASGDLAAAACIRRAAHEAMSLPEAGRNAGFLVAAAALLDPGGALRKHPALGAVLSRIETDEAHAQRTGAGPHPTFGGREDLAAHYAGSLLLTAWGGATLAEAAGLAKEIADAQRGSGFSFRDLTADLAAIELARQVLDGRLSLKRLAAEFDTVRHLPELTDLPEGLNWDRFQAEYGGLDDARFVKLRGEIRRQCAQRLAPLLSPAANLEQDAAAH